MVHSPTHENLRRYGTPLLAGLLVRAATERSALTYGRAAAIFETAGPFSKIFSTEMGLPAGDLMDRIHERYPDAPLLNVLLVRQDTRYPGDGAGTYLAQWFGKKALAKRGAWSMRPKLWSKYCDRAIGEVYAFTGWNEVIQNVFGPVTVPDRVTPVEQDEIGGGEGKSHRELRLWAMANPGAIDKHCADYEASTEVTLLSGDRVDVILRGPQETVCIEVKSHISNFADLERGLYQCIKYRAVAAAMDARKTDPVRAILVTQTELPGHLRDFAKLHEIGTKLINHPLPKFD